MSRLTPFDRAIVLVLVPLWMVGFLLSLKTQVEGGGAAWIGLSVAGAWSHPVLTGEYSLLHPANPLESAGLQAGDSLISVGGVDLRGANTFHFMGYAREVGGGALAVPVVYERQEARREASLPLAPVSIFRSRLVGSIAMAAMALFLMLRAPPTPMVRAMFGTAFGIAFACLYFVGSWPERYAFGLAFVVAGTVTLPLGFRFLLLFPDDRMPEGTWHRVWPWFFAVHGLFQIGLIAGHISLGEAGMLGMSALGTGAFLVVGTHKYRHADAVGRRQMRWVLFGAYCAFLPFLVAAALGALEPRLGWLSFLASWALPLVPLSILVSVARYNLFDIDRVISVAASYNIVVVLLVGAGLVAVPRAAEAASGLLGMDSGTGQVALSLLLAGVLVPAHRRLHPHLDRLFFKERYALDHGIADLLSTLSSCADARALTKGVGDALVRLLRPEACVVYAPVQQSYAPVFVEGRTVPPAFETTSPLIGALQKRHRPLSLDGAGRRPDEAPLGAFDRAALETLHAEVVVPVSQDGTMVAFVCLGSKRSGDVYTSTDLSHLASVAEKVATELRRFDQEETVREAREMQESLRRYVPGAVAEQLAEGEELTSEEREVSVLFVDIRGYTSFSETRRAEEIFSTVNRYTETVSQIAQRHSGSVVEFNGDGMMAVFGAPRELAHKERAAVEAGREIVEAVNALPVGGQAGETTKLSVGVGIATGLAFVGNIQAADRMIWSAIGNTTNLAARLQSLTRDLEAALVIDRATWERAQTVAADFHGRPDVPIRGRRETQHVYTLPLR